MEFPNYASSEISAVIAGLLEKQSGHALHQLDAMREALEAAARTLAAPSRTDQHVQELVSRLTAAADGEVQRIRAEASAAIDKSRNELRAHLADHEKLGAALARAEAEGALLKSELHTAQERLESADRDLTITVEAHAEVEGRLRKLEAEWARAAQARSAIENDLAQAHATVEHLLADVEQLRKQIERHVAENAALHEQAAQVRTAFEQRDALADEVERTRGHVQALEAALADAQRIREHRDRLATDLDAAGRRIHDLESELGGAQRQAREHGDRLGAQLEVTGRRIEELERELATAHQAREHRDRLAVEVDATSQRIHALERELAAARDVAQEHEETIVRLETTAGRVPTLEASHAQQEDQLQQLTRRLEEALRSEARLQEKLASRPAELPAGEDNDLEVMRAEVDRMVALLDASARAVTEMAATTTANDLLTELLKRLSLQFSRVALFRVKGNRLEGEQQVGFDDAANVTKLAFPLSADSMLVRAINSRTLESVTGSDTAARTGLPFGGSPTAAVAVPIVLQGATVAVVYGDDSDMPDWARGPAVHESSVGFARLLVGQVAVLLMRHTHEMKTLAELRQYATTLLQEAKEMYLADAQAGKPADLLRSRLKDNLECASQLYTYRAAMEGTAAAALLDEQIVAELEESTPFAQDLAKVVADMAAGDLRITAEAS